MPDVWAITAIVTKFALYLGVLTSVGTVMTTALFQLKHTRGLSIVFALIGLIAALFAFSLRGANLTGDASGMIDPEMLGLLWSTPVGTALALRLLGLVILLVGLFIGSFGKYVSIAGGVMAIWSFNHIGHVSSRDTMLLDFALTVHLIAIALWIGVLTPLRRLALATHTHAKAADLGHRFGLMASAFVPLLIFAGLYMGYVLVGSFEALFSTGYGQALILKIVLVGFLLGLAAANKLRFVPGLRAGDTTVASHLAASILAEWIIILAVLATTVLLTSNLTLPT
jgi:putative copper resistance protein D